MAKREPGYCFHKPSGQAYIRLAGKAIYLGPYESEESRVKYNRIKAEWLVSRESAIIKHSRGQVTVAELCLAYLSFAAEYYGEESSEYQTLKYVMRPMHELYATLPAADFGVHEFRAARDWWLRTGNRARQYINTQMKRTTRIIKWAVGEGMIPASVHEAIKCVAPLRYGHTSAKEALPISPVDTSTVTKTIEHAPSIIADMINLQLLLGCRPGELVRLTPAMVDRTGDVWVIRLSQHKTAHRGKTRTLYAGKQSQAILVRYLLRDANKPLFSPAEVMESRRAERSARRITPPSCGNRRGTNVKARPNKQPGEAYTTQTYGKAIKYICKIAFPPPDEIKNDPEAVKRWNSDHSWAPNQLRHARATEIRSKYDLEHASSVLGHSDLFITQVYAERDQERALRVAREVG
jgi:integrase